MIIAVLIVSLLGAGLILGGEQLLGFINVSCLLITLGGTFAVTLFSFSWSQMRELGAVLYDLFAEKHCGWNELIEELKRLAHLHSVAGPRGLESQENSIGDPFVRRGVSMVVDLLREEEIREQLEGASLVLLSRQESARRMLLTVGRLFPAFGLIGTLTGLILILRQIPHANADALSAALSVAILTTLYGAVFANVLVYPLASKVESAAMEKEKRMRLVIEGVVCLAQGAGPATVERRLAALLPAIRYEQGIAGGWFGSLSSAQK